MFDNYIIEIRLKSVGITVQAGIVVRDGHRIECHMTCEIICSRLAQ